MTSMTFDFAWLARSVWPRQGLPCRARTRDGGRCRGLPVLDRRTWKPRNGRCRMHGGRSTGPGTNAGRAAVAASNRLRADAARLARALPG